MSVAAGTTIDLNRIDTFVRVVRAGSFTAAALDLGLPKSSVSRGVAALEAGLGVRLLHRTTRKLSLTDAGRRYFEAVQPAIGGVHDASISIADSGREARGTVRLTTPAGMGDRVFAALIAGFL